MKDADASFMNEHREALLEISKVLAGQAEPTRELFEAMARILAELLTQHEAALEAIRKTQRNAGKRERKASH